MKYSCEDLKKIYRYEEKRGIRYAKSDGKLYKFLLLFGFLSWLWMATTELLYILGKTLLISGGSGKIDNVFIALLVSLVLIALSVLFYALRLRVTAFAVSIIGGVLSVLSFARITRVGDSVSSAGGTISEFDQGYFGLRKIFYWRHGIPVLLVTVLFASLIVIIVRERRIMKREYEAITENSYDPQFTLSDE